ncbi:hypothetical protein [Micromonospora maritima]|uniref:hypothetical protein n=1 Tax=Micromonospora maritima TaxID=986711 RepID=UPI00157CEB8B|nr:hypothetical protein [Micromonospora maritima]
MNDLVKDPAPAVGQVWRGVEHGSLFRVLLVHDGKVTFQVMHQGNPQNEDWLPVGQIHSLPLERWLNGYLEFGWLT